ncbi:MAG: hypothetical protein MMC33_003635 [Icmadophila ericetorum]|nr:hypothetical protein [Icmadophila ericetorum]
MAKGRKPPHLPIQQLIILSICRFAEPVALTSVFPYLPEMIESFNVPRNEVAKWAGLLSATFSLSQCLTGIAWGRASDEFGRKPVIILGLLCTMTASVFFGFSRNLAWAMVARSFAGMSNGNVGIIRTTVAEMVPFKELQPRAFSIMPLVWTIGSIFGPAFGGALADPAKKYPAVFGNSKLLQRFPFALPNLISCIFFLVGIITGILFLRETLETKKHSRDYGRILGKSLVRLCTGKRKKPSSNWKNNEEQSGSLMKNSRKSFSTVDGDDELPESYKNPVRLAPPSYREVFSPQSSVNIVVYSLLALHSVAYDQLLAVFMHLPTNIGSDTRLPFKFSGGFGLNSDRIGLLFTIYGVAGMFIQFLIFPPLARHYGVLPCLKAVAILFPIVYILTPFTVLMPTSLTRQIAIFIVMLFKCWAAIFAFPCTTILLTNSAKSLRLLGTLNGVATSFSAIGRATGPTIGGATFTLGVNIGYGILPWWTLAFMAILGAIPCWWLIEMEGFNSTDSDSEDEDEDAIEDDDEEEEGEGEEEVEGRISLPPEAFSAHSTPTMPSSILHREVGPGIIPEEDDDFAIEDAPLLSRQHSRHSRTGSRSTAARSFSVDGDRDRGKMRRLSNPIGMGEPVGKGGRRLSNALGQTFCGLATGGSNS